MGAGAVVSPSGIVKLPRSRTYTDPDDVNGADSGNVNLHLTHRLNDLLRVENRTLYQGLQRDEASGTALSRSSTAPVRASPRVHLKPITDYSSSLFEHAMHKQSDASLDFRAIT